ncbi:ATP-binding cassette domain-containing protein [Streptomyces olivaceoviridis]|uniref:ATP-binding cassette domain-containing protein n=1 Tax=Streptomyces olivaceoviridis TaxID=1921 RepID=UPI003D9F4BB3
MAASDTAILAEGLGKSYRSHTALHGIDLEVPAGTVLGVLGPNGAGKTTTVRILATLVRPTGGRAAVAGYDVVREGREVRRRIGLAGQYAAVDELLTGRENLVLLARLLRFGRRGAARRAAELLDRFELTEAADRPAGTYSGGMRRRLDLATCVIGDPEVLFLDEPTTGLDPASRNVLWDVVRDLAAGGVTILLTTQYLEEADQLADRIAVIDAGRVIAEGTPDSLKRQVGSDRLEVTVAGPEDLADAVAALAVLGGPAPVTDEAARRVSVQLGPDGLDDLARAAQALRDKGVPTVDIDLRKPTLDDVFFDLTGTGAEQTPQGPAEPVPAAEQRPVRATSEGPVPEATDAPVPAAKEGPVTSVGAEPVPAKRPAAAAERRPLTSTTSAPAKSAPLAVVEEEPATVATAEPVPAVEQRPVRAVQGESPTAAEEPLAPAVGGEPVPVVEERPVRAVQGESPTAAEEPLAPAVGGEPVAAVAEAPAPAVEAEPPVVADPRPLTVTKEESQ